MSEPFVGEIRIVGFNFAPKGWAFCNGQIMSIAQNTALFSLLGTTYGGNGQSTFALPNMQGNAPVQQGQGAGLSNRVLDETAGEPTVTLISNQVPAHQHTYSAGSGGRGGVTTVAGNANGDAPFQTNIYGAAADATVMNESQHDPANAGLAAP